VSPKQTILRTPVAYCTARKFNIGSNLTNRYPGKNGVTTSRRTRRTIFSCLSCGQNVSSPSRSKCTIDIFSARGLICTRYQDIRASNEGAIDSEREESLISGKKEITLCTCPYFSQARIMDQAVVCIEQNTLRAAWSGCSYKRPIMGIDSQIGPKGNAFNNLRNRSSVFPKLK